MMDYKIKTYEEAIKVIEEIGLLPLAPLIPDFPSLNSITSPKIIGILIQNLILGFGGLGFLLMALQDTGNLLRKSQY